jgi:hypothetical protein
MTHHIVKRFLKFEMRHPIIPIYTDIQKKEAPPIQGELCTTSIQGHTPSVKEKCQ